VKLPDLVNTIQRKGNELRNVLRYPIPTARRLLTREGRAVYENTTVPGSEPEGKVTYPDSTPPEAIPEYRPTITGPVTELQPNRGSVAQIERPPATLKDVVSPETWQSWQANYPLLQEGESLRGGWWGPYTLGQHRSVTDTLRIYDAIQDTGGEPVWIYEYLLTDYNFNLKEARTRQIAFRKLVDLNLRMGNGSDFRLQKLIDVITVPDRTCYLITAPVNSSETLADYIRSAEPGKAMPPAQVRELLRQVLQSLQYIHGAYRVRWSEDRAERQFCHGNLNLETLLIRHVPASAGSKRTPFFVYLTRFALWEHLFQPPTISNRSVNIANQSQDLGTTADDFRALGEVAFQLLKGQIVAEPSMVRQQAMQDDYWPQAPQSQALKPFILRLMGVQGLTPFKGAEPALAALRKLPATASAVPPTAEAPNEAEPVSPTDDSVSGDGSGCWLVGGLLALLAVLGFSGWSWWVRRSPTASLPLMSQCREGSCKLSEVQNVPSELNYWVDPGSSWNTAFYQSLTGLPQLTSAVHETGHTKFERVLESRREATVDLRSVWVRNPSLERMYGELLAPSGRIDRIDFLLLQSPQNLPDGLVAETVAYDAIVPLVAFSDANRQESIPNLLEGEISLEDLKQLYLGQTDELRGSPVQLYTPRPASQELPARIYSSETRKLFARLLVQSPEEEDQLLQQLASLPVVPSPADGLREDIYARLLRDFETGALENRIGIGFDRVSRVWGQCSVYPLAVQNRLQTTQVMVNQQGEPITPQTDLCGDKSSYWPNARVFKDGQYPLAFELVVVYPECVEGGTRCQAGKAFVELLQTAEGQYLLSSIGLVPTMAIETLDSIVWEGNL